MSKLFIYGSSLFLLATGFAEEADLMAPTEIQLEPIESHEEEAPRKSPTVKAVFSPFTGKVSGSKVRVRLQPDLDSPIVKELEKNEFVTVIDQEGEFYSIEAPASIKAYVFRSFVLDNVVEGNRVNVRLHPDLEAPIIGHLNSGDRVQGDVCSENKKWLEISPPETARFYVAKEFVDFAGGPEMKQKMIERGETVSQLQEAAKLFALNEMVKPFEDINFEQVKQGYLTIVHDYADFPTSVKMAKEGLAQVQESYLQKRIEYLEKKASLVSGADVATSALSGAETHFIGSMNLWSSIEQGLYRNWAQLNENRDINDYYEEQRLSAVTISGTLEPYKSSAKNKPGDYVLKNKNIPVAYVYSTKLDLEGFVGKKVTLVGSSRDNHHFALPAYFVHEVE